MNFSYQRSRSIHAKLLYKMFNAAIIFLTEYFLIQEYIY